MTLQNVQKIVEKWARANTVGLSHEQSRKIGQLLAPIVIADCRRRGQPLRLVGAGGRFTRRTDAEALIRRCLEHYELGPARRLPQFKLKQIVGHAWQWITEDVFGVEYKPGVGNGVAGVRG